MKIEQFKIECKRTCPSLGGGLKMDLAHMVLGMNTEIVELREAFEKEDMDSIAMKIKRKKFYIVAGIAAHKTAIPATI